ncbi:hypothetical protein JW835_03710 [bacterium]|nr:hypothetical protein [bacterium]RQV98250.1 MAG: hypothetical protein EH221_02445 [bacterium]
MIKQAANICLIFCLFMSGLISAQTDSDMAKEVTATGMGSIINDDVAHARDDAIEDALRKGLEQVMGLMVSAETLVENYQLIEDNIFSKTQGYVQNYEVIQEGRRSESLYEVTVKAVVKLSDLKSDLDAIQTLIRRKNTPRMMVLIEETNIGETPGMHLVTTDLNTAETAIMDQFMSKGFRFVDQQTVKANLDRAAAAAILKGNIAKAAALGKSHGAEVVVTGKAVAKATETEAFGTKIRSQQATVTARAIRTDTGDIIATGSAQGAFPHIDDMTGGAKAIQKACAQLSDDLMQKILDRWQSDVNVGATMTLKVQGITGYSQLKKFEASLKYYVRGLTTVTRREYSGQYATFEVEMKGNSDDLAERLDGQNIDGIQVRVIAMSQNSVTVELK